MMVDLCTVTNSKYLPNAIALVNSYIYHAYTGRIFLYYFDISNQVIEKYKYKYLNINFVDIPKVCKHAYEPNVFFYKAYALKNCISNSDCFLYSDATNLIQKNIEITDFFLNDSLFLPYTHPLLINKHWTTQKCLYKMNAINSSDRPQYWAGLQGYKNTKDNKELINLLYDYMLDPEIAYPNSSVRHPDGQESDCIEHRQDQSVLSILIDLLNRHHPFLMKNQLLFGDQQTFKMLDPNYIYSISDICISSRQTKFLTI
jgi:hypothetical protein